MRPAEDALRIVDRMSAAGFRSWLQDWSELAKARLSLLVLLTTLVGLYCGAGGVLEGERTFSVFAETWWLPRDPSAAAMVASCAS